MTIIKGKPVFYDPPEVKAAKQKFIGYLTKYKPRKRYKCRVRLVDRQQVGC